MAKGHKGPGMGRPAIEWDKAKINTFEALMGIPFVTEKSICTILEVSQSSLIRWIRRHYKSTFDNLKEQKQQDINLKLAGKQYEIAMKGNVPMLIWLGKNRLGQSDKVEQRQAQNIQITASKEVQDLLLQYKDIIEKAHK